MQERAVIEARRAEREKKRTVLELQKRGDHIPIELLTPILDPDVQRKREAELGKDREDTIQLDKGTGFIGFDTALEDDSFED